MPHQKGSSTRFSKPLLFLSRQVLHRELKESIQAVRAKPPQQPAHRVESE